MKGSFARGPHLEIGLFIVAFIVSVPVGAADDPKPDLAPVNLTIRLPADADLEILGKKVEGSGELRHETVTPIKKEAESLYTFKASWTECDTVRTVKRSLRLKPGAAAELDLNLDLNADEKAILSLINKEREKAGLQPLIADPKLNRAARSHSLNMAKHRQMDHSLDGKGPGDRLKDGGYHFLSFGENCGSGALTPVLAVQMWMNSDGHKANILTGEFNETGIGIAGSARDKFYTQVFAVPAAKRVNGSQ